MRALAEGTGARATIELKPGTAREKVHFEVWASLAEGASFRASLVSGREVASRTVSPSALAELPGAGFGRFALDGETDSRLELVTSSGAPRFYGVIAEGSDPGLVLDAVGIDGARLATALAWDEASFEGALAARAPSLVALAFGTNEAFDADRVDKYRSQYRDFLDRVRRAAPSAGCLIVAPPAANAVSGGSEPRIAEIDALERAVAGELRCGFVSEYDTMGGAGSYTRWANKQPPLARGDRLHLSPKGYEVVANTIADRLLAAYDRYRSSSAR